MAEALTIASATVLEFNGHQVPTAAAVEVARSIDPGIGVRAAPALNAARDDRALAASVVEQARHVFGDVDRLSARLSALDPKALVDLIDETSRMADQPCMVVSVRLRTRVRELFNWPPDDDMIVAETGGPLVAVRTLLVDDDGDTVVHMPVSDPDFLVAVRDLWGNRGAFIACVGASCLIDTEWQRCWLGPLLSIGKVVMLIDIELDRFVNSWVRDGTVVRVTGIETTDTSGPRRGIGILTDDPRLLWLALGDGLGMDLLMRQLHDTAGLTIEGHGEHLRAWDDELPVILTHLLATESFFDLEGLEDFL